MQPGDSDSEWLSAGKIGGAHGIKGWVKVHAFTDDPQSLLDYTPWQLRRKRERFEVRVEAGRLQGKGLIAKLEGCDDRDSAEAYRGTEIWVPARELPALEEGEFYWRDLIGLPVTTEFEGRAILLGEVDHLLETGANDVLVLRPCAGSIDGRERLLPYLPGDVVLAVVPADGKAAEAVEGAGEAQAEQAERRGEIKVRWHPDD